MQIKLILSREEYDELDSFLDQAINTLSSEEYERVHHGIEPSVLARIHEKMIKTTERVMRDELVMMNASEGRQRLSWRLKDE